MSKRGKRVREYFNQGKYIFFYNIFERLTFFAFYISIARYVTKDVYGLIVSTFAFTNILASIFDLGFPFYIQRESATNRFSIQDLSIVIILKIFLIVILLPIPLIYFAGSKDYTLIILMISLVNFYQPLNQILIFYLNGRERFKENFYSIFYSRLFLFIYFVIAAILRIPVQISLMMILLALIFQTFYLMSFANVVSSIFSFKNFDFRRVLKLIKFSLPFGLGVIFAMTYDRIDVLILRYFSGDINVATYSVAYSLYRNTSIFSTALLLQSYNIFSRLFSESKELKQTISNNIVILVILSILLITIFYLFGRPIISILFGVKFIDSFDYLKLLSLSIPLVFFNNFTGILLNSFKLERLTMITTFAGLIINLISNLILIPRFNIYGAVYSTIITEGSILMMHVFILIQFKKYKRSSNA